MHVLLRTSPTCLLHLVLHSAMQVGDSILAGMRGTETGTQQNGAAAFLAQLLSLLMPLFMFK
jgi:hypothetical protein